MAFFEKYLANHQDNLYVVFRSAIGVLFFMLGLQKIFGLWGMPGGPAVFGTLIWFAGVFEFMIGSSMIFGVLTRLASFFGVIMMAVAYYLGHVSTSGSWNPMVNFGMPAIAFGLAFIITLIHGAKKASLERKFLGKEIF
ncbi:MAG: DoxX family protein [Candidatus Aenigmarchaeota archaeon]|nr:DoxX family protein [Candidatus Aenigmarchaeota archaeon]